MARRAIGPLLKISMQNSNGILCEVKAANVQNLFGLSLSAFGSKIIISQLQKRGTEFELFRGTKS